MPTTDIASAYALRIRINYAAPSQSFGISERYNLISKDPSTAYADAQLICQYRRLWLAPGKVTKTAPFTFSRGPYIARASLHQLDTPKDALVVDTTRYFCYPTFTPAEGIDNLPTPPNDRSSSVLYGFTTGLGTLAARGFRLVSDDWLVDVTKTAVVPISPHPAIVTIPVQSLGGSNDSNGQPPVNLSVMNKDKAYLQRMFLNVLLQKTCALLITEPDPDVFVYTQTAWSDCVYKHVSSHRTGKPYGDTRGRDIKQW